MNQLLFFGLFVLLTGASPCNGAGCNRTIAAKVSLNAGIKENGQGISAGKAINSNGGVSVNANNGPGVLTARNSVISGVNKGSVNVNTGRNSSITSSGNLGSSTQNSGFLSGTKKVSGAAGVVGVAKTGESSVIKATKVASPSGIRTFAVNPIVPTTCAVIPPGSSTLNTNALGIRTFAVRPIQIAPATQVIPVKTIAGNKVLPLFTKKASLTRPAN